MCNKPKSTNVRNSNVVQIKSKSTNVKNSQVVQPNSTYVRNSDGGTCTVLTSGIQMWYKLNQRKLM